MEGRRFTKDLTLRLTKELQSQNPLMQPTRETPREALPVTIQGKVLAPAENTRNQEGPSSTGPAGTGALKGNTG